MCLSSDCCYFFFTWLSVISVFPQRFSHGYLHYDLCFVLSVSLTGISTVISALSSAIPSRVSPQWSLLFPHVSFTMISHRLNLISAICLFMDWTCSLRFLYLQAHLATGISAILFHGWSLQFLFYGHLSLIAYEPIFSMLFIQRDFSWAYLYDLPCVISHRHTSVIYLNCDYEFTTSTWLCDLSLCEFLGVGDCLQVCLSKSDLCSTCVSFLTHGHLHDFMTKLLNWLENLRFAYSYLNSLS